MIGKEEAVLHGRKHWILPKDSQQQLVGASTEKETEATYQVTKTVAGQEKESIAPSSARWSKKMQQNKISTERLIIFRPEKAIWHTSIC